MKELDSILEWIKDKNIEDLIQEYKIQKTMTIKPLPGPFKPWWEYGEPNDKEKKDTNNPPPFKPQPPCECGAMHTSFPKHHSRWCPEHPDNKPKYW